MNAVFNVTLSAPSSSTVTVDCATAARFGERTGDYIADNGTVTFNPGEVSKQIVVQVVGDITVEPNETYSVNLSNPTNATIAGAGFGSGTITDDDARTISIGNNTFTEVDAGLTNVVLHRHAFGFERQHDHRELQPRPMARRPLRATTSR